MDAAPSPQRRARGDRHAISSAQAEIDPDILGDRKTFQKVRILVLGAMQVSEILYEILRT